MRPDFGEQPIRKLARRMLDNDVWLGKWLWFQKVGTPPMAYEDFTEKGLMAFLNYMEEAVKDRAAIAMEAGIGRGIDELSLADLRDLESELRDDNQDEIVAQYEDRHKSAVERIQSRPRVRTPSMRKWGPPAVVKQPSSWDEAVMTGDRQADEWEKKIAEGLNPFTGEAE